MAIIPGNTGTTTKAVDGIEGATSGAPVSLPSGFSGPSQRPFSAADADLTMTVATHGGLVSMTPTAARVVTLPSTSVYTGYSVEVINLSSAQNININASGGGQVYILSGGQSVKLLSTTAAPTLPGQWAVSTAGSGSGLNEQPVKNYLQAIATAVASAGTLSTVAPNGSVTTSAWFSHVTTPFTMVQDTSTPLRGTASYLSATNTGASSDGSVFFQLPRFQLELADRGKPVSLSLDITGVTAANQWDVVVVRYNNAGAFQELIPVAGTASNASGVAANGLGVPSAQVPSGLATMRGFFVPASDDSYYAVRFRRLSGSTQIRLDTLYVGPQVQLSGAAVTDMQSYTPTFAGLGTVTGPELVWGRSGDRLFIEGRFTTGTVAASVASFTTPNGVFSSDTDARQVGRWWRNNASASTIKSGPLIHLGSGFIFFGSDDYTAAVSPFSQLNGATLFDAGQVVNVQLNVAPIANWSSNTTMAERAVEEYAFNTGTWDANDWTNFGYGINGVAMGGSLTAQRNKRVRFQSTIQATDKIVVELQVGGQWVDSAQYAPFQRQNAAQSGVQWFGVNSTDIEVAFLQYVELSGATFGVAGSNWSSSIRWRVRKVSGGAVVGYPVGVQNIWNAVPTVVAFPSFNPPDLVFSFANAPSRTIHEQGSGAITVSSISSGTVTFTFGESGKYNLDLSMAHTHGAAYTNVRALFTLGGTATRYDISNSNDIQLNEQPNSQNAWTSSKAFIVATAGQTLTVRIQYAVSGSGVVGNHSAFGQVMIQRVA